MNRSGQHDDHIWLTVNGEAWAIRAIERPDSWVFRLWRGYYPELEFLSVEVKSPDWDSYCEAAIKMLRDARAALDKDAGDEDQVAAAVRLPRTPRRRR
jgi:hypothetical protein